LFDILGFFEKSILIHKIEDENDSSSSQILYSN